MKSPLIVFIILVTHSFGNAVDLESEVYSLVQMDYPSRVEQIQSMPLEHRKELMAAIKALPIPGYRVTEFDDLLVNLGDEAAIRKEAELMIQHEDSSAFHTLCTCRDPQVIASMCPIFLLDPRKVALVRPAADELLYYMLPNTPGFSPDVYEWAARLKADMSLQTPWIFREWWKANEDAFKRKDYKAVKPGKLGVPSK